MRDAGIPNHVVVAPMAEISNAAFRIVYKKFGTGLVVCEMISDHGITYRNKKTLEILTVNPREHPMDIQILGGSEEALVEAVHYVDTHTATDIINISMGYSVSRVAETDAGARWLLDPNKIYQMVHTVVRNISKPVTVKMRTGWDQKHIFVVESALATQGAGTGTVAMHGRTREQMYVGEADWETLKEVADTLAMPFVGNGGVTTPEKTRAIFRDARVDAVMVGRAALGNPRITKDMVHYLDTGEELYPQTVEEKIVTAKKQLDDLVDLKGEKIATPEFRRQATYYLKRIPRSIRTRARINDVWTKQEIFSLLDDFVEKCKARQKQFNR